MQQTDAPTHAIDRIGAKLVREHFVITRQAVSHWRCKGVPRQYRKPLILLGKSIDVEISELELEPCLPVSEGSAA